MPRPDRPVNRAGAAAPLLHLLTGVEPHGAAYRATTAEPWFRLDLGRAIAGRWIEIRYRAGYAQDPVRPLLRIERPAGPDHAIMPGPVCGSAIWVGRIPDDAVALAISPVCQEGPFAFAVDRVRVVARPELVAGALLRNPGLALNAVLLRLRGKTVRARHFLASIWASTPFHFYDRWRGAREAPPRLPEPETDLPPRFGLLIEAMGAAPEALSRTLASLVGQTVPWQAWILGGVPGALPGSLPDRLAREPVERREAAKIASVATDWIGAIGAGDVLAPDALACCAAAIRRDPAATLLYTDEDRIDAAGRRSDPRLKPDWSPRLQDATAYLGGLTLVRADIARHAAGEGSIEGALTAAALEAGRPRVGHARRVLLHRPEGPGTPLLPEAPAVLPRFAPLVSAVIPNRDNFALLKVCIEGFRGRTAYPHREVVIVDNGSVEPATLAYYDELASDPHLTVLRRPGPFNFSKLTNEGVAASSGGIVLMLNNDIEVIGPEWLDHMVRELAVPDVGAVGAKLLYPDGHIQHSGVAIGLGGAAGHVYRGRKPREDSWMGRLTAPHEVSAVTGACLAVTRAHFDAVGGLDETLFPVSFNDIDFCLRLRREGWRNILAPAAVLYHHESASRGRDVGPKQERAAREARHFAERWLAVMRDDPYFHPGLSLLRFDVELG